jgi:uncharacterized protein (DUF305 family)
VRGWRFGLVALAVALVMGVLVGLSIGVLTLRPTAPGDTSPEAGFARDMSVHHAQAVSIGTIAYQRSEDPAVRQLGLDIALAQQNEIGRMQQWLREWRLLPTGASPPMAWMPGGEHTLVDGRMPGMASPEQMEVLRSAEGAELDRMFLALMIDHHLGGIHMIDGVLPLTGHGEVTWLAGQMKANQQTELEVLRSLLARAEA